MAAKSCRAPPRVHITSTMLMQQAGCILARVQPCSRGVFGSLIAQSCTALLQADYFVQDATWQGPAAAAINPVHGSVSPTCSGRSQHMHNSLLLHSMLRPYSSAAEETGTEEQVSISKPARDGRSRSIPTWDKEQWKNIYALKITSLIPHGLQNVLITDVLNMMEDPNLMEFDVKISYDTRNWLPNAFYVLYRDRAMRDAALAMAGANGKTQIGTVPVQLSEGQMNELQVAIEKSRILAASNRHASSKRDTIHHHGRVVLMTAQEPIEPAQVTEGLLAGFDLVHPRVIPLTYNFDGWSHKKDQKRALVFFAHPDEAARAVRTCHGAKLVSRPVQMRVIQ